MGLAASQARLLNMTARMHDIEYKAQNLEAQKLQMANESDAVYHAYEEALNATKIQYKVLNNDGTAIFKDADATALEGAGYSFEIGTGPNKGNVYSTAAAALTQLQTDKLISDGTISTDNNAITNFINEGLIVLVKLLKTDGQRFIIDPANEGSKLDIFIKGDAKGSYEVNVATDTNLQEVQDDSDLKKAEAKYEADMRKINNKDKKFDTDLSALEAERNAVKTEMETLKSVVKDNVDRSFKLFS